MRREKRPERFNILSTSDWEATETPAAMPEGYHPEDESTDAAAWELRIKRCALNKKTLPMTRQMPVGKFALNRSK